MSALGNLQPLAALPAAGLSSAEADSGQEYEPPDVRLVPLPRVDAGSQEFGPALTDPQTGQSATPAPALGAIAFGPGAAATVGRATAGDDPVGDDLLAKAQALLDDLRRRIWADRGGNALEAVARVLRARKALRAVLFLDPANGVGLWVDVGPDGRTATAVILIKLDWSAGLAGLFMAYDPTR